MVDSGNPFSLIFPSPDAAERQRDTVERQKREIDSILTRVLLCTPSTSSDGGGNGPRFVVVLPQLAKDEQRRGRQGCLDLDNITQALAERLQMSDPASFLRSCLSGRAKGLFVRTCAVEPSKIVYLAQCFARANSESVQSRLNGSSKGHVIEKCKQSIVEMTSPVLHIQRSALSPQGPEQTGDTFTDLLLQSIPGTGGDSIPVEFFCRIADTLASNPQKLKTIFEPALSRIFATCKNIPLSSPDLISCFSVLELFGKHEALSKVLINSQWWLPQVKIGKSFESHTLIGRLLSPSSIALTPMTPSPLFPPDEDILSRAAVDSITSSVQLQLEFVTDRMHKVFDGLLRASAESKKALICWLAECFERNQDRGKMMSRLASAQNLLSAGMCASDGFFLNLSWVMLRLAAPFAGPEGRRSLLTTINPVYCTASKEQTLTVDSGGALVDFTKEARLVPVDSHEGEPSYSVQSHVPFNFITHCFFLTHESLILGMTQVLHRFDDVMRVYSRAHDTLVSIGRGGGMMSPLFQQAQTQFKLLQSQVLGLKAHVMHPQLLDLCLTFYTTTAQWLVWLAAKGSHDPAATSHDVTRLFPLPKEAPLQLRVVPECLVENMANFFSFLRRSQADTLNNATQHLRHLITFATVFMGSPQFILNPHIRANISQLISLMVPREEEQQGGLVPVFSESQRELFESHDVARQHLIQALMTIFVDIEFTGDSMEFEAKFQYRIPMYEVLKFLWGLPSYQSSIKALGHEAVRYEGTQQEMPILLRFINMMINDATVQLDEGLESLVQIRELQNVMESEEWESFSDEQKKEYQQKMSEASFMAKNRNLLAGFTMEAMELMTGDITEPFVLPTMVNRIAAMLNYVLKQMVGPKRRELKVKDMHKYHFKPKELVCRIVSIYVNLGQKQEFCEALPRDGRSFSISILEQAVSILRGLGRAELMSELLTLMERVKKCSDDLRLLETAYDEAPDEFLDPVTNEIMTEPVLLPTSGVTMDKANVIRHLLSDQTDPFNRAPLTADMLQPNHDLRQRIEDWKEQKRRELFN